MVQYPNAYPYANAHGMYQQNPLMQPYQPMDNRLAQMQANYQNAISYQQPQMQNYGLNGEIVDSIDVVKAKNVDMSGAIVYYPQSSGECIYTKQLQPDGTSRISIYRIEKETSAQEVPNQMVDVNAINGVLGQFKEELLNEIKAIISTPAEPPRNARGGSQK